MSLNIWELPYTLLLLSPFLATTLSISYFLLKAGVNELLTIKNKMKSTSRKLVFIIIIVGYIIGNTFIMTQLQNVVLFDGEFTIMYILSIAINILCSWLITNWYYN